MVIHSIPADLAIRAAKTAAVTLAGGVAALVAQIELPTVTDLGVFAAVALLVGRYTMRQLEDYRADLKIAHERADQVAEQLRARESELREVMTYAHRLALFIEAEIRHVDTGELPTIPDVMKPSRRDDDR